MKEEGRVWSIVRNSQGTYKGEKSTIATFSIAWVWLLKFELSHGSRLYSKCPRMILVIHGIVLEADVVDSQRKHSCLRFAIMVALSTRQVVKWILRNTCKSRESLTPEIELRLITETCPMWMSTPDQCPLRDPYWAFYWPGGQALTRFILDNHQLFVGSHVLDFGAGCGATSIAAIRSGAQQVLTNDIDINAILAARLNFKLNKTAHWNVTFSNANLLLPYNDPVWSAFTSGQKSYILLGDMFYDTEFAAVVLKWLQRVRNQSDVSILVGDPGRHPLADQNHRSRIGVEFKECLIDEYALPGYVTKEHYGFTSSKVFQLDLL